MGARDGLILRIFLAEGLIIAGIGAGLGFGIGILVCVLQQQFGLIKLEGSSFLVDAYPVIMNPMDFLLVSITIIVIGVAASWYPAKQAAKEELTVGS